MPSRRTNPPNNRGGVVVNLPPPLPPPSPPPSPPRPPRQGTLPMGPLSPERYSRRGAGPRTWESTTSSSPPPPPPPPPPRAFDSGKQARQRTQGPSNPVPLDSAVREMRDAARGVFEPPRLSTDIRKPVSRIVRGGDAGYVETQRFIRRAVAPSSPEPNLSQEEIRTRRREFDAWSAAEDARTARNRALVGNAAQVIHRAVSQNPFVNAILPGNRNRRRRD